MDVLNAPRRWTEPESFPLSYIPNRSTSHSLIHVGSSPVFSAVQRIDWERLDGLRRVTNAALNAPHFNSFRTSEYCGVAKSFAKVHGLGTLQFPMCRRIANVRRWVQVQRRHEVCVMKSRALIRWQNGVHLVYDELSCIWPYHLNDNN